VEEHSDGGPMVIVDTLEKVRGLRGNNPYADDYKAGTCAIATCVGRQRDCGASHP